MSETAQPAATTPERRWNAAQLGLSVVVVAAVVSFSQTSLLLAQFRVYWVSNAVILGILLLVPRRQLPLYFVTLIAVVGVATTLPAVFMGRPVTPLFVAAATLTTALAQLISVLVLRRDPAWIEGRTESVRSWLRFVLLGIVVPQLLSAILGTLRIFVWSGRPLVADTLLPGVLVWFLPNVVSMFVLVPIMLRLRPSHLRRKGIDGSLPQLIGLVVVLGAVATVVMLQSQAVLLFLMVLPLVLLLFRHGVVGVVIGAAVLVPIVLGCTSAGLGPLVAAENGDIPLATIWAQLFMALLMASGYLITALLYEQQRAAIGRRVYRVIAENAGDVVLLIDPNSVIQYAAPATAEALGVDARDFVGTPWQSLLHREDLHVAEAAMTGIESSTDVARFLCRIQHSNGSWRWFDARIKVAPKVVTRREHLAFKVALCRDVTEATAHHEELQQENRELAQAAATDPLTGLANRRALVVAQAEAWTRAAQEGAPLGLLIIDVDHFKAYNDRYGHEAGDRCLVGVADAIRAALSGHDGAVVGRYGGEEFVVLLPGSGPEQALQVAHAVLRELRRRKVEHVDSSAGIVTASVGVATAEPARGKDDGRLFAAADTALYQAKRWGRDRAEVAP